MVTAEISYTLGANAPWKNLTGFNLSPSLI